MSEPNHLHAPLSEVDLRHLLTEIGKKARLASRAMAKASTQQKNTALLQMAMLVRSHASELKVANAKDLAQAAASGNDAAFIDRLTLTDQVIESMAVGLEQIVILQDPIGEI
jgi:glutamate-5-semialdehyde dehydrogenase